MPNTYLKTQTFALQRIARDSRIRIKWKQSAESQLKKYGKHAKDVSYVLMDCQVIKIRKDIEEVWIVEGADLDNNLMNIEIVAYEDLIKIKVINVYLK